MMIAQITDTSGVSIHIQIMASLRAFALRREYADLYFMLCSFDAEEDGW